MKSKDMFFIKWIVEISVSLIEKIIEAATRNKSRRADELKKRDPNRWRPERREMQPRPRPTNDDDIFFEG